MRVSIVLCTYNGEKFLSEQLDSLVSQSYPIYEIVVQDDCSSDKTLEILYGYIDKLPLKIEQNSNNLGFSSNFIKAITRASGELIALCDQDDVWLDDKLEVLVGSLGDAALIYSNSLLVDSRLNPIGMTLRDRLRVDFITSSSALNFLYNNCASAHSMLFKKELVEHIAVPMNFYFDHYIAALAASYGGVEFVDRALVLYRQHDENALGGEKQDLSIAEKRERRGSLDRKIEKNNIDISKIEELLECELIDSADREILNELHKFSSGYMDRFFSVSYFLYLLEHRDVLFKMLSPIKRMQKSFSRGFGYKFYRLVDR